MLLPREALHPGGGEPGSQKVHCRRRPTTESKYVTNGSLQYSYETCDNLGSLKEGSRFEKWVSGMHIQAGIRPYEDDHEQQPLLNRLAKAAVKELRSIKPVREKLALDKHNAAPTLYSAFSDGWWSEESKEAVESMQNDTDSMPLTDFSYCLHDVAIGRLDLCVAPIWVTPERAAVVSFLPPVRFDHFYFVETVDGRSLLAVFRPFSMGAWGLLIGFLVVAVLLHWADRRRQEQKKEKEQRKKEDPPRPRNSNSSVEELTKAFSQVMLGDAETPKNICLSLGLAFFMLIVGATYTAHLAEHLIANPHNGKIGGWAGAIRKSRDTPLKVCVDVVAEKDLKQDYPNVEFQAVDNSFNIPRELRKGNCRGAIMPQYVIELMHKGELLEGNDRGCDLQVVDREEVVLSFAVSFAVSNAWAQSLSWATTKALSDPKVGRPLRKLAASRGFAGQCRPGGGEGINQFGVMDLLSSLLFAFLLLVIGVTWGCVAHCYNERASSPPPQAPCPGDPASPPSTSPASFTSV